jgi:transcription elongation GreA/GreB family factor
MKSKTAKQLTAKKLTTEAKATARAQKRELTGLRRERKAIAVASHRELNGLRKQADKIVARYRETDSKLSRRIAILETRLS